MKFDKRTIQTFAVSIFLIAIFVQWIIPIYFWVKVLCLFVGLLNFLGWFMDQYFNKKYGRDTLVFAKESYPAFFERDKTYINQSWAAVQWREIKEWWSKLWAKE